MFDLPFGFGGMMPTGAGAPQPTAAPTTNKHKVPHISQDMFQQAFQNWVRGGLGGGGFRGVFGFPDEFGGLWPRHHGGGNGGGNGDGNGDGSGNPPPPPNPTDWPLNLLYPPPIGTGAQWRHTMSYGA